MSVFTPISSITTAEQLLAAGDIGRCELIGGKLVMMSPASPQHGAVAMEIGRLIANHVVQHRLGEVFAAETGFVLDRHPDTVRAPDVAFITSARRHQIPTRGFFPGAPDLAVEVLSPDDPASDVLTNVQEWLDGGARQVWIVDHNRRTIAIHRSDAPTQVLREDGTLAPDDLLPGLTLPIADLFRAR